MRKLLVAGRSLAFMLGVLGCCAYAQSGSTEASKAPETRTFYQLTYVLKQVDGDRVLNTRTYNTSATAHGIPSSIRAGEKVPFASGDGNVVQWQQIDVGVNLDSRDLELIGDRMALRVTATVNSVAPREEKTRQPTLRHDEWDAIVLVPLKRPTIIFSSENPFSTQKIQLQLTVTPM